MSYLNTAGLDALWARIGELFGRKTEAAGSANLSGTTLNLNSISGGTLSSVDLGGTFATDSELSDAVSNLESEISSSAGISQGTADGRYGRSLIYNSSTGALTLLNADGSYLSTVYLNS